MPVWAMKILGGLGVLAFAVVALILFGNSRYHSGQLAERVAWQAKQAAQIAANIAKAATVDRQQVTVAQRIDNDHSKQDRYRAAADAHTASMCKPADSGGSQPLPALAAPAEPAAGASDPSVVVADNRACADAVERSEAWIDWWTEVSAIPR